MFDPRIAKDFEANPNWKAQAKSLMKKDTTETPFQIVSDEDESEMMAQFREFQQFKNRYSNKNSHQSFSSNKSTGKE